MFSFCVFHEIFYAVVQKADNRNLYLEFRFGQHFNLFVFHAVTAPHRYDILPIKNLLEGLLFISIVLIQTIKKMHFIMKVIFYIEHKP